MRISKAWLTRHARAAGFLVLAVVTVVGVQRFFAGDWSTAVAYWRGKLWVLPAVFLLAVVDVALEGVGWMWVYGRFGMRVWDGGSAKAFLAGRAGLLLPVQLGRVIRPDAMARLKRAPMAECLKAEAVVFALDATSVGALVALVAAIMIQPLLAPFAAATVILLSLFLGNRVAAAISHTSLALPAGFWWSGKTLAIIVIEMAGWAAHGAGLYLLVRDLPGDAGLADAIFFSSLSSVVGAGSGLPGGIGATEGLLGVSLSLMQVPAEHLALAVAAFRLVTFWIWIPIGWIALVAVRGRAARLEPAAAVP